MTGRRRELTRWLSLALAVGGVSAVALGLSRALSPAAPQPAAAEAPRAVTIQAAHGASYIPALAGKRPLFILVLGSDARPGQPVDRSRADSIHLIGVNPAKKRATIVGFPRDSWVHVPGRGNTKINEGMVVGGPQTMVSTVEGLSGIRIDFWLLTSFQGLEDMVNAIGGLTVDVRYPMFDRFAGTSFSPGEHHFNGGEALAFTRDRHSAPGGDFGRSENQGRLLLAALSKLRSVFDASPGQLFKWVGVLWRHVQSDLRPGTLLELAFNATQIDPKKVNNIVLPGSTGSAGGASVVFLSGAASSIFADLRADGFVG